MPFKFNPFTKKMDIVDVVGGPGGVVESITGNSGGAVFGDGSGNINLVGSGGYTFTGDPGNTTLTLTGPVGGVSSVTGTTNQVTATPTTGAVVLSTPSTFIAPGSIASTSTVTAGTNLAIPASTVSGAAGVITQGGNIIYHNYNNPTNTFLGRNSGNITVTNTSGQNTSMGGVTLNAVTTAINCAVFGYSAGGNITTGSSNSIFGAGSGNSLTTGTGNSIFGRFSGNSYTSSESNNIIIGTGISGTAGESNVTRIGNGTTASCFITGINGGTVTGTAVLCATNGQLGTIASSERYKENIKDMDDDVSVMSLRPVEFNYIKDEAETKQYGLIAEEVDRDFPYLCFYNEEGKPESVKYHEIPVFLLKEVQRLTKRIEELEKR